MEYLKESIDGSSMATYGYYVGVLWVSRSLQSAFSMDKKGPLDILLDDL